MSICLAKIDGHILNVGDISTVAPARWDQTAPRADNEQEGVRVTFRSKGTSLYFPGLTADGFMDKLVASTIQIALPD